MTCANRDYMANDAEKAQDRANALMDMVWAAAFVQSLDVNRHFCADNAEITRVSVIEADRAVKLLQRHNKTKKVTK